MKLPYKANYLLSGSWYISIKNFANVIPALTVNRNHSSKSIISAAFSNFLSIFPIFSLIFEWAMNQSETSLIKKYVNYKTI